MMTREVAGPGSGQYEAEAAADLQEVRELLAPGASEQEKQAAVKTWFFEHGDELPEELESVHDKRVAGVVMRQMTKMMEAYKSLPPTEVRRYLSTAPRCFRYSYLWFTNRVIRHRRNIPGKPQLTDVHKEASFNTTGRGFYEHIRDEWVKEGIIPGGGIGQRFSDKQSQATLSPSGKRRLVPKPADEDARLAASAAYQARLDEERVAAGRQAAAAMPAHTPPRPEQVERVLSQQDVPPGHVRRLAPAGPSRGATAAQDRLYEQEVAARRNVPTGEPHLPTALQRVQHLGPLEAAPDDHPLNDWRDQSSFKGDQGEGYFRDNHQTPEDLYISARDSGYPQQYLDLLWEFMHASEGAVPEQEVISTAGGLREAAKDVRFRVAHLKVKDLEKAQGQAVAPRPISQAPPTVASVRSGEAASGERRAIAFFPMDGSNEQARHSEGTHIFEFEDERTKAAVATNKGLRGHNEDNAVVANDNRVSRYGVPDGAGGHAAGEKASALAANRAGEKDSIGNLHPIVSALYRANEDIQKQTPGGVTTYVGADFHENDFVVVGVGDSRAYFLPRRARGLVRRRLNRAFRGGSALEPLTVDQNARNLRRLSGGGAVPPGADQELIASLGGVKTSNLEAATEAQSLTGIRQNSPKEWGPGDRALLISDGAGGDKGLTPDGKVVNDPGFVPHSELMHIMATAKTPREAAERITEAALKHGSNDNITVIVVEHP